MALDPSIISQGIKPYVAPDLAAIQGKQLTLANLGLQNQIQQNTLQNDQLATSQNAQLNDLYKGNVNPDGTINRPGLYGAVAAGGLGSKLPALQKGFADTDKSVADAQKTQLEVHQQKINAVGDSIASLLANPQVTHDQVIQNISLLVQQGVLDPQTGAGMVQSVPGDPATLRQWLVSKGLEAHADSKRIDMLLPQVKMESNGKVQMPVDMNPVTNPAGPQPIPMTTTPGEDLSAQTSRQNNAATIGKDFLIAGRNPDGSMAADFEPTAQGIASGRLPAPTGAALMNPKNQALMGRVMDINPNYDFTDISAKKAAATAFTSGPQGNALRSFAVAGQHLDQLGQLVDALDNGNVPAVNALGNMIGQQTGGPAVTNFNAAKDVVGKEVIKAIVAGGGGQAEREELAKSMAAANSPAQLKGVIDQYTSLMGAQHDALLAQRRAAGLPDSTIPNYGVNPGGVASPAPSPAGLQFQVPADVQAIINKHTGSR